MEEKERIVRRRYTNIGISSLCMFLVYFIGCQASIKSIGEKVCLVLLCCFVSSCFGDWSESLLVYHHQIVYITYCGMFLWSCTEGRSLERGKLGSGRRAKTLPHSSGSINHGSVGHHINHPIEFTPEYLMKIRYTLPSQQIENNYCWHQHHQVSLSLPLPNYYYTTLTTHDDYEYPWYLPISLFVYPPTSLSFLFTSSSSPPGSSNFNLYLTQERLKTATSKNQHSRHTLKRKD